MSREPISFAIERKRHERFVGRDRLLARLDELLIADSVDRWVVVTGGPGMGKSAMLAAWLARREAAGDTVPHHFIRRGWANGDDPEALAGSLVAQIDARCPDAREPEADARLAPAARLAAALLRVSERALVPRGERLVLLVDGLDEYDPRPGSLPGDPLAGFLPYALPRGVSVLCASRPRHPYVDSLATHGVLIQIDLDDAPSFEADNTATVRAFWEQAAAELDLDAPFVARAVERAGGNLEHAAMLHRQLAGLPPENRRVDDIPRGLAALIASAWERIATEPAVVDGLGILCAAREPLTLDELGRVARWTGAASRQAFVRGAREWLIETRRTGRVSEYRLHHDAIRAHVADAIGSDALAAQHLALAERLATWPAPADATARRYALHHALLHRAEAGAWADAWRVAADVAFLEAKCRELGVHDAEAEMARTAERCCASGDEAHGERFADLARALGRESHWLRAAPEATAALVWNRLRRYGWTARDLDAQLRVPAAADFLRVRHATTRESPALVRNLEGHTRGVTACAVTPDGRHVISASDDHTLKVWELASGRAVATLRGHTLWVRACAVTPDGRHLVSASDDQTLKVWDLATYTCCITHRGDAAYFALAVNATTVIAGDAAAAVWFLDVPRRQSLLHDGNDYAERKPSRETEPAAQEAPMKHTILFLAANPLGTDRLGLDREARAIQVELERSGFRDRFELVTRWAVEPLDLLRELRKLRPTVVHFSGHGAPTAGARQHGLFLQGADGRPQLVSAEALEQAFDAAGSSVKLVVLNACYSEPQAAALVTRVDCVIGMRDAIRDEATRSFAIGFYGGLGERESIAAAYKQGCAAISLEGLSDADRPQLRTRRGVDAAKLVLAGDPL